MLHVLLYIYHIFICTLNDFVIYFYFHTTYIEVRKNKRVSVK